MPKLKCDIVICIWNKRELTQDCIESIYKNTRYPYRLVLIDNASDEETKVYLESLKNDARFEVILIRNEKNLGNTIAVNQGLKSSGANFICNLDNDTYVTEGWLTEMISLAQADSEIGIVTCSGRGGNPPASDSFEDIEKKAQDIAARSGASMEMATADCFCALFTRELINEIGVWDEEYSPGYFDDTDYCRRATKAGFKITCALGAYVYHREGGSFSKNKKKEDLFNRNKEIYLKRYGQPKRVLYINDKQDQEEFDNVMQEALKTARQANWVWVFLKASKAAYSSSSHSHIKSFVYADMGFPIRAILRLLTRQKKRFDQVYVSNLLLKNSLRLLKPLHHAEVKLI